ncbi:cell wall hydrolase [Hansschlegelia zhihuaiae]|uniref:Cell wall hydrolase n=1 Tax=Hansschlegelia zhihuaiae TaxID=405005 RepID=A0A4Q0MIE4_9HYPH|nr:cell wall hydrolase [Hansschlegelia zhihuaiae]RXF73338.1 cell wall hydrolase [Hansschlegelia zhihuaiae]
MLHRPFAGVFFVSAVALAGAAEAGPKHRFAEGAHRARSDRECMARAMYFESDRNAEDGMLAVGTVVANRLESGHYGSTICEVVGRKSQFAPGVLRRAMMEGAVADRARKVADAVLAGERHPAAGGVKYFHTADVPFRKTDKRYLLVSGGNAFYERRKPDSPAAARANAMSFARAVARADEAEAEAGPIVAAALAPKEAPAPAMVAEARPVPGADSALAYGGAAPAFDPSGALAAVAALKPRSGPRVIAPQAPVLAAAIPMPANAEAPSAPPPATDPLANRLVAAAWALFQ